jgi:hypothetical protein
VEINVNIIEEKLEAKAKEQKMRKEQEKQEEQKGVRRARG